MEKAKKFLSQVADIEKEIQHKVDHINMLRASLGLSGISYDADKIQTSPDPDRMSSVFAKIEEDEEHINYLYDRLVELKVRIIDLIEEMDSRYSRIIYDVYIKHMNLKECASDMNFSYRHIKDLHHDALNDFESRFTP